MSRLESQNPRTGAVVGSVPVATPDEVRTAVEDARKAFVYWSALSHAERRPFLKTFKRVVVANADHIADVVCSETGKDRVDAYTSDIMPALSVMDYYARKAGELLKPVSGGWWPYPMVKRWTEYHPRGVVGAITPWNVPFFLTMLPVFTAVAAGNGVVAKPSEITPLSGQLCVELATEAGLPKGLIRVVHGAGETGQALIAAPVDVVWFTGSTANGRAVAVAAAERLIPVVLELGGNDAMVVLEDADLRAAAQCAVWAATYNAGQICMSVERVYVPESVYEPFLAEVDAAMENVAAGTGDNRDVGAITDPRLLDVLDRQLADAVAKGAEIRWGGSRVEGTEGTFFAPTVLTKVDHSMDLMHGETFGPVLPVMAVPDEDTALQLANAGSFGLHGSVWSADKRRAARWASKIESGTVAVNDHLINPFIPDLPFGGIKDSGHGRELGPEGIRGFCYIKSITSPRLVPTTRLLGGLRWMPRRLGARYWRALARLLFRW